MLRQVLSYYDFDYKQYRTEEFDIEEPRICNHCDHTGEQIFISGVFCEVPIYDSKAICFFSCYFCMKISIHFMSYIRTHESEWLSTNDVLPKDNSNSKELFFSPEMVEKFPEFVNIYNQSQRAQDDGLNQIAGMGFRKALEFLVTDFLLSYPPDGVDEEWLTDPKTSLSNKIEKLENQRIKKISKAISFIGNDETHYTRRHPEHDVESIKTFIKALLSDVENEMTLLEVEKLLNKPK